MRYLISLGNPERILSNDIIFVGIFPKEYGIYIFLLRNKMGFEFSC